jgi:hypothetical protein
MPENRFPVAFDVLVVTDTPDRRCLNSFPVPPQIPCWLTHLVNFCFRPRGATHDGEPIR